MKELIFTKDEFFKKIATMTLLECLVYCQECLKQFKRQWLSMAEESELYKFVSRVQFSIGHNCCFPGGATEEEYTKIKEVYEQIMSNTKHG